MRGARAKQLRKYAAHLPKNMGETDRAHGFRIDGFYAELKKAWKERHGQAGTA